MRSSGEGDRYISQVNTSDTGKRRFQVWLFFQVPVTSHSHSFIFNLSHPYPLALSLYPPSIPQPLPPSPGPQALPGTQIVPGGDLAIHAFREAIHQREELEGGEDRRAGGLNWRVTARWEVCVWTCGEIICCTQVKNEVSQLQSHWANLLVEQHYLLLCLSIWTKNNRRKTHIERHRNILDVTEYVFIPSIVSTSVVSLLVFFMNPLCSTMCYLSWRWQTWSYKEM